MSGSIPGPGKGAVTVGLSPDMRSLLLSINPMRKKAMVLDVMYGRAQFAGLQYYPSHKPSHWRDYSVCSRGRDDVILASQASHIVLPHYLYRVITLEA